MNLLGRRHFTFWIRWPQSHLIYGRVTTSWCCIKCILRSSLDEPLQLSKACPNYADLGPILWLLLSFILMELVHGEIRDPLVLQISEREVGNFMADRVRLQSPHPYWSTRCHSFFLLSIFLLLFVIFILIQARALRSALCLVLGITTRHYASPFFLPEHSPQT